ncbi:hypothetical protein H6G81_34760 [Scytonema hofmannii FACHB-248]|uniref:Uncharacterized protein n=1 Tax=Scytonema hofmannii FACHB-248 TaxID=1842502 RepID=A0ABR8H1S1_9CYAN|nr:MULTISPECIES: hypothetical protein [Nostocales]MBD2609514.1 hypothetical protein [Scytonema hofmannii FACHB-248]
MISNELMESLTRINNLILLGEVRHPARFALLLEELAGDAWNEARRLGQATWDEAENLQPSIRIDP